MEIVMSGESINTFLTGLGAIAVYEALSWLYRKFKADDKGEG